jgi:hypothetical protein
MSAFWVAASCSFTCLLLLVPWPSHYPDLLPHGVRPRFRRNWFLDLKPIPRAQLTHRPDDGSSRDLWNSKLLPNYTAPQTGRQPDTSVPTAVRTSNHTTVFNCARFLYEHHNAPDWNWRDRLDLMRLHHDILWIINHTACIAGSILFF